MLRWPTHSAALANTTCLVFDAAVGQSSRKASSLRSSLRHLLLLLLLTAGATGVWAQTPDYSGTYYIATRGYDGNPANTNNYYLCPTEEWIYYKATNNWDTDGSTYPNPFLTTYKCKTNSYHSGDPSNAVWIIEKHPTENYYYIKHKSDGKYMVSNGKISGSSNANRIRVHLESVAPDDLDDKALFFINTYSQTISSVVYSYLVISPKSEDGWNKDQTVDNRVQDLKYYSVNNGNQNYLQGNTKPDGPGNRATGGVIGVYTENDANAQFYFEDVITRPTIICNTSNQIEITAAQSGTVTIKYTTDGSTPSATNGVTYSAPFIPAEGVTTIKAVTIGTDWVSNVATYSKQKHLIQNQNNVWNTTDFHFYMVPGDEASGIAKVNTTSLFRPSMEWTFQSASVERGIHYYYIINNANNKYLCYDATNAVYMDDFGSGGDKFKFFVKESSRFPGTFHIIPYGQNILVTKNNSNASVDNVSTVGNVINSTTISENAHWKFILPTDLDTDAPFTVSDATSTSYYKIASVGSSGYYIVPGATNATTSNSTSDNMNWYFEVAQAANASDWLTYYHIRNAVTGDYLYFTKDANNTGACLATSNTITAGSEDRYKFTWAKTADANVNYYIIPKNLKDISQNQFSALQRDNGTLKTNLTRGAGNYAWTFEPSSYHCIEPEVSYDDANNQIEISSTQGVDVYYTINGANDVVIPSSSTHYILPLAIGSSTQIIRAVCARSADGSDNSDVVSIILNPTVTLNTGSAITYDGSSHQPTISSAAYNSTNITGECIVAKYLDAEGNVVSECINAGVYTVVITDEDGGDYYVYGTTTFTINKADISPNVTIANWSYGDAASNPIVTGNDGEGVVTYEYKPQGAADGDYSTTVPEAAGNYTVRATIAASTNYNSGSATATFTISPKSLGDGTPAPNITCDLMETNGTYSIVVKQGETKTLTAGTSGTGYDYSTGEPTEDNDKYYAVTVTGANNYTGYFSVRLAKIQLSKRAGSVAPGGAALFVSDSGDGNFVVPDNMTAYIVTGISGNTLITEQLDNIPDHVPVLLVSTIDANGFLVQPEASATPPSGTNLLVESTGTSFGAAEIYLLYKGEFVLNAAGTVPAGKIYLPRPSGAPVKLFLDWDFVDGIDMEKEELRVENEEYYTLDGIKLGSKPTRKGLYITNGRKVAIK